MKIMKRFVLCGVLVILLCSLTLANGLNVNGLGARAIAMGGAFVGLADDFTAIFWNPAGIAQFSTKTFGLTIDDVIPSGSYQFPLAGVDAKMNTTHNPTGLIAYYHPISENLVFGFGVYTPSGLASKWEGSDFSNLSFMTPYEWHSKIAVIAISPTLAYKVSEQVMFGATLNINYGLFEISTHAGSSALVPVLGPQLADLGQQSMELSGWGFGATFGLLVKPSEMFSFGATFRTPSTIKFKGDIGISKLDNLSPLLGGAPIPTTTEATGDVKYPLWLCGGIAFKPTENFTLTADVQYTKWSEIGIIEFELTDPTWNLINANILGGQMDELVLKWSNATQIRFGAEYQISSSLALRAGYYRDPSPAPNTTHNVLVPNFDFNCFACGFGYASNGFNIDFFFELLKGTEREVSLADTQVHEGSKAMPGTHNLTLYVPGVSIGYSW